MHRSLSMQRDFASSRGTGSHLFAVRPGIRFRLGRGGGSGHWSLAERRGTCRLSRNLSKRRENILFRLDHQPGYGSLNSEGLFGSHEKGEAGMQLLSVKQVAKRLGIPEGAVRGLVKNGRLSPVRVGESPRGKVFIPEAQVLALSLTGRVEPALSTR